MSLSRAEKPGIRASTEPKVRGSNPLGRAAKGLHMEKPAASKWCNDRHMLESGLLAVADAIPEHSPRFARGDGGSAPGRSVAAWSGLAPEFVRAVAADRLKALGHQTGCGSSRRWPPAARTSARSPARWAWQRPRCRGTWVQVCARLLAVRVRSRRSRRRGPWPPRRLHVVSVFRSVAGKEDWRQERAEFGVREPRTCRAADDPRAGIVPAPDCRSCGPGYGRSVQPSSSGHRAMIRSATSSALVPSVLYTSPTPPRPGMLLASSWA